MLDTHVRYSIRQILNLGRGYYPDIAHEPAALMQRFEFDIDGEGLFLCYVYPFALGCPAEGYLVVHQTAVGVVALYGCHYQPCAAGQFKGV